MGEDFLEGWETIWERIGLGIGVGTFSVLMGSIRNLLDKIIFSEIERNVKQKMKIATSFQIFIITAEIHQNLLFSFHATF